MNGRINAHRNLISVFAGDLVVNLEQISITLANGILAESPNRVREIEIDTAPTWTDSATFIADLLGRARRNIARRKISEAGIFSLQIIIAIGFRNRARRFPNILFPFRNPDASIVAQGFGHEC